MEFIALILVGPLIAILISIQMGIRFIGMHRVSNEVFLNLIQGNKDVPVIVKAAGNFGKARHYILALGGIQIYTLSTEPLELPSTVVQIPAMFRNM